MAYPTLHRGVEFNLYAGDGATPTEAFAAICIATTVKFDMKVDFDDAMVIDCAAPTNLAVRQSVAKGQTWDITFSGKADYAKYKAMETAWMAAAAKNYQIVRAGTGANGGGVWQGGAVIPDLSMDKNENGMVTFSATLRGQGLWAFTAAT